MFDIPSTDFKSPMSTIPSRGHHVDFAEKRPSLLPEFAQTPRSKSSQNVGTVAQFPAQHIKLIPDCVLSPGFQEEFWAKTNRTNGCWEWHGNTDSQGYGRLRIGSDRAHFRAHRVAYRIAFDKDPGHLYVCHRCDNPLCCNPSHLFLGTADDNNQDRIKKGRTKLGDHRGAKNGNAKLTEDKARRAVELILMGWTNKAIGKELGIGHSLISRIRVGRSWRELSASMGYVPRASKQAPKSGKTKCKLRG